MNGLKSLRTAFWSLAVSLGVLMLLFILRPEVTEAVAAFFNPQHNDSTFVALQDVVDFDSSPLAGANELPSLSIQRPKQSQQTSAQRRKPKRLAAVQLVATPASAHGVQSTDNVSRPAGDDPFESGSQQLALNLELAKQPPAPIHSPPVPDLSIVPAQSPVPPTKTVDMELRTRLASLQSAVERLNETESARRTLELQRAADKLKQQQQTQRLNDLERQIQGLKADNESLQAKTATTVRLALPAVVPRPTEPKVEPVIADTTERFSLQIRRAEITEVLELLGQATGHNIVIGEGVVGTVPSANLRDVTVVEAVESIIQSLGLSFEQKGEFIYVKNDFAPDTPSTSAAKVTAKRDAAVAQ